MSARPRPHIRAGGRAVLLACGALALSACQRRPAPTSAPAPLKTPGWTGGEILLLRTGRPGVGDLLLRHIRNSEVSYGPGPVRVSRASDSGRPIYAYTRGLPVLSELSPEAWDAADSTLYDDGALGPGSLSATQAGAFNFDTGAHTLKDRKSVV